jgi:CRISPR/Cas system-associated protein Cas5 (RAMP superfamily)
MDKSMIQIFRITEKEDSKSYKIAVEFQLFNPKVDSKTIQKIVRALLSEGGIESTFGLDDNGNFIDEFKYEVMVPYMLLYEAPRDGSKSEIKLMYPSVNSMKDIGKMFLSSGDAI